MGFRILNEEGDWIVQVQRGGIRRTRKGSGGETEAQRAEDRLIAELDREIELAKAAALLGITTPVGATAVALQRPPILRDYFKERWIEHAKAVQNEATRAKSVGPFNYVLYYLGDRPLSDLTERSAINDFVEKMKNNGALSFATKKDGTPRKPNGAELSNSTINKSLQRLRALLYLAHEEKKILSPPKIDLLPEDDSVPVVPPTEEQFQQLLIAADCFRDVASLMREVIEFAAETGLRRAELLNLTFKSVDIARRSVRVEMQQRGRIVNGRPWKPKYLKWREVPLSARALEIVQARIAAGPVMPNDLVFPNRGGAPYVLMDFAPEGAGKGWFRDVVEVAGLKDEMSFHSLRHLFAVRLLTRGVPITVVSELLGHSDINLTVKRYGRFSSDAKVKWDAIRVLDKPHGDENAPS